VTSGHFHCPRRDVRWTQSLPAAWVGIVRSVKLYVAPVGKLPMCQCRVCTRFPDMGNRLAIMTEIGAKGGVGPDGQR